MGSEQSISALLTGLLQPDNLLMERMLLVQLMKKQLQQTVKQYYHWLKKGLLDRECKNMVTMD